MKKRKKGMSKENAEEDQKKIISTGSNRPFDYSFGTALTDFFDHPTNRGDGAGDNAIQNDSGNDGDR